MRDFFIELQANLNKKNSGFEQNTLLSIVTGTRAHARDKDAAGIHGLDDVVLRDILVGMFMFISKLAAFAVVGSKLTAIYTYHHVQLVLITSMYSRTVSSLKITKNIE